MSLMLGAQLIGRSQTAPPTPQLVQAAPFVYETASADVTATLPATATSGNLLVACLGIVDGDSDFEALPTGYTLAPNWLFDQVFGSNGANISIYYKTSDGTETAVTIENTNAPAAIDMMFISFLEFTNVGAFDEDSSFYNDGFDWSIWFTDTNSIPDVSLLLYFGFLASGSGTTGLIWGVTDGRIPDLIHFQEVDQGTLDFTVVCAWDVVEGAAVQGGWVEFQGLPAEAGEALGVLLAWPFSA